MCVLKIQMQYYFTKTFNVIKHWLTKVLTVAMTPNAKLAGTKAVMPAGIIAASALVPR